MLGTKKESFRFDATKNTENSDIETQNVKHKRNFAVLRARTCGFHISAHVYNMFVDL